MIYKTLKKSKSKSKSSSKSSKSSKYKYKYKYKYKSSNLKSKKKHKKKTIYYFFADYCGYCKRFDPLFYKLKRKYGKNINFKKIDGKKINNKRLMLDYKIKLFPTLIIKETKKPFIGDREEKTLIKFIKDSI